MNFSSETPNEEAGYNFGDTGGAKGMVRFFINVGRNVQLTPKIVADEVSELVL